MTTTQNTIERDAWEALRRFYSDEGRAEMEALADEVVPLLNELLVWARRAERYAHVVCGRDDGLPDELRSAVCEDEHYDEHLGRVLAVIADLYETLWLGRGPVRAGEVLDAAAFRAERAARRTAQVIELGAGR